jgi:uncharacterized membrane protein
MYDKNESIHLWMLEQERQKSQTLTLEQQKTRQAAAQSKNIPDHLLRGRQEASDEEGKTLADNEIEDIDQLLREKEALEEESKRLDEEKKQLVFRAKMRLEREIQDMKKMNSEKQQDINQLKKRLSNLEAQDQ